MKWFLPALLLFAAPAFAQDQANVVSSCGSVTLKPGSQSFRTIDLNGGTCAKGRIANCTAATTYLARTTGGNEGGNAQNIKNLICGLVGDGVWAKLDALYVPAQQNVTDATLNLIDTSRSLAPAGNPFTPYRGFSTTVLGLANGAGPGPNLTLNSASFGAWVDALLQDNTGVIASSITRLFANHPTPGFILRINAGANTAPWPTPAAIGYYSGERSDAANIYAYYNGTSLGAKPSASTVVETVQFVYGGPGSKSTISATHIGASLGPTLQLALYNRLSIYMRAVGVDAPCQAARNYLARTSEGLNSPNIAALICGLVSDGIITGDLSGATGCGAYFDGLYIFAQQNAADAKLNLCGTSYSLTVDAATIFQPYIGFSGFTVGMDTGYNVSTSPGRKWAMLNAGFGAWEYNTPVAITNAIAGSNSAPNASTANIFANYTGNTFYGRVNTGTSANASGYIVSKGMFATERADNVGDHLFHNNIDFGVKAAVATKVDTDNFWFGRVNGYGGGSPDTLSAGYMGGPLGSANQLALYNRLRTYMTAVGVP